MIDETLCYDECHLHGSDSIFCRGGQCSRDESAPCHCSHYTSCHVCLNRYGCYQEGNPILVQGGVGAVASELEYLLFVPQSLYAVQEIQHPRRRNVCGHNISYNDSLQSLYTKMKQVSCRKIKLY